MVRRLGALLGAVPLTMLVAIALPASPAAADQTTTCSQPAFTCEFTTPSESPATTDRFVASFEHPADVSIDSITMAVTGGTPEGCTTPAAVSDSSPFTPPGSPGTTVTTTSAPLSFGFDCNGLYDIRATAHTATCGAGPAQPACPSVTWSMLAVEIPAPRVRDLTTAVDGGGGVTVSWTSGYDGAPPHDFVGYALDRVDGAGNKVPLAIAPDATSYQDVDVPASGTYTYEVVSRRTGAADTTTASRPTVVVLPAGTDSTTTSIAPAAANGGGGTVTPARTAPATPSGPPMFDSPTLADDTEPGDPLAQGPNDLSGAAAVQQFDDGKGGVPGAGLAKPFAAALAASVWAGLFLFLSRRAASADRALRSVQVEHLP